ncbi:MAG: cob(I)yrinic acid a,c-diamide adenosyltransferase [Bacteroidota bacterium]
MKIYTRTGDKGTTGLFGGGRVNKDHLRIEAYGTVDETNSVIGIARGQLPEAGHERIAQMLHRIQSELFVLGADLATPTDAKVQVPRIEPGHVATLEAEIDMLTDELPPLKHFILPGGAAAASTIHLARTVCRRAERRTVALQLQESLNEEAAVYLNRLSDLLFVMARWLNKQAGISEEAWKPA